MKQLEQQFIKNQLTNIDVFKELAKYDNSKTFSITYSIKSYLHRISKESNLELGYLTIMNIAKMKQNHKNNVDSNQIIIHAENPAKSLADHLSAHIDPVPTFENTSSHKEKVTVSVNEPSSKFFKSESEIKIKEIPTANAPRFNIFERDNNSIGMLKEEEENNNRLLTTEADVFPSDARLYEELTLKSKISDIAGNNDSKHKNDSTEKVKVAEANEQTSQRQTTSSQKKSYLIFSLIKFLQAKKPFLIKTIAIMNLWESLLIFVFMICVYMMGKDYIGNSFEPIKTASTNLATFFNSFTITTLFAIREEFKIRGLTNKTTEDSVYKQMFDISIEESFKDVRRIMGEGQNDASSFDYVKDMKTNLHEFASSNKNETKKMTLIVRIC